MKSYFGKYQAAPDREEQEATVLVFDKKISIGYRQPDNSTYTESWTLREVQASYIVPRQQSRLLYQGKVLWIDGKDAAESVQQLHAEREKPWYRKNSGREWMRNSLLLLVILGLLTALYFLVVPWLSEKMASKVSIRTEQKLGDAVYDAMGLAADEDTAQSRIVQAFFDEMKFPTPYAIRIAVVNDNVVNAFALPGGRIVVYKALLVKLGSSSELAALLAHEFTHVNHRHSTRSIFRRLGSRIFLGLLFGRMGAVTSVLVNNADALKSLTYSRSLEKEADLDGLKLLTERGIDPSGFTGLFERLKDASSGSALPEFLGSHPDIGKRIRYVQEAAGGAAVRPHPELEKLFLQLQ